LADAPAEKILRFAQKWGVLELCEHDVPAGHPPEYWPTRAVVAYPSHVKAPGWTPDFPLMMGAFHYCLPRGDDDKGLLWEPVEAWRQWARAARSTLNIAARLRSHQLASEDEWRIACNIKSRGSGPGHWQAPTRINDGWQRISRYLNSWLRLGSASVMTESSDGSIGLVIGKGSLFGTVAVQLTLAVSGTDGPVMCSSCKSMYVPARRPRRDQKNYCRACGDAGVPQKNAAATYRVKKTKKRGNTKRNRGKVKRRDPRVSR
jgi:hypothetical protein